MSYSLADKLFAVQPFEETAEVLGRKVVFRILSAKEEAEIVNSIGASNLLGLMEGRKIPTLARAVVSIDGVGWGDFPEIKQRIQSRPGTTLVQAVEEELAQPRYTDEVLTALYAAHSDVRQHYRQNLEELKKNSTAPSPATSG